MFGDIRNNHSNNTDVQNPTFCGKGTLEVEKIIVTSAKCMIFSGMSGECIHSAHAFLGP